MHIFLRFTGYLSALLFLQIFSGCAVQPFLVDKAAEVLAMQEQSAEDDIILARDASAFYLKLSESVLQKSPGNLKLAHSVTAGFTQYAYAFVAFEAEKLEPQDAKAAQRIRVRAARLYLRAHQHAMRALEKSMPGFMQALIQNDQKFLSRFDQSHVGVAYWAAAAWGGYISLSKDDPDKVADLPLAIRLATLAWAKDPHFGNGGLTSLLGTFEASRTGGSLLIADQYFDQAIAQSRGQSASPWVSKAENIAIQKQDKQAFTQWLQSAIRISEMHRNLENEVMRERASWLLEMVDDLF